MKQHILAKFKNDPVGFLARTGIFGLKVKGRQAMACCPFHVESNPSFSINVETGLWHCFAGCGSGDLFTLWRKINSFNGSFFELLQEMDQP